MQARAIFEAAVEVSKDADVPVEPEVAIPLVSDKVEFDLLRERIDAVATGVFQETGTGTVPRGHDDRTAACRLACRWDRGKSRVLPFGTNDLTQTTFGLSRDDTAGLLKEYERRGIFETDPFVSIDIDGVGELVKLAAERDAKRGLGQARHLRRTRRRSSIGPFLRRCRSRLCFVFPLQGADCAPGCCTSGAEIERLGKGELLVFSHLQLKLTARRIGVRSQISIQSVFWGVTRTPPALRSFLLTRSSLNNAMP